MIQHGDGGMINAYWKGPTAGSVYMKGGECMRSISGCVRERVAPYSHPPRPEPEARENTICQEGKDFHFQFVRAQVSQSDGDLSHLWTTPDTGGKKSSFDAAILLGLVEGRSFILC